MKIGQVYLTQLPTMVNDYSENLVPDQAIVSLRIYACPGSKFKINNGGDIIMNSTGNFTLQCESFPITDIRVHKGNLIGTIPTIIDYVSYDGGI